MSGCGHLFIVGMNTGHVEIFNIQSGLHRGELVHDSHPAHQSCVRGIASSLYYIITAGADGLIKVWSFRLKTLLKVVELPSPVTRISFHKESELLGVACDNFHVHVVDVNNGRIVRTFAGHCGKITDICISPDSRWLITSSVDCSVRTWDIPTGHMIDIFTCETPPTSVTMSPTSNFIATTHIDELGIFLWANKTLYSTVSLKPIPVDYQPSMIQLPSTGNEPVPCDRTGETTIGSTTGNVTGSPLCEGLLTLSALPKSQWHSLLYIDIIKKRNKPKEPVQPMKPAPFFLPTQPGPDIKFIAPSEPVPEIEKSKSRILLDNVQASAFQRAVIDYSKNGKYSLVMDLLKGMGPAAIDLEFQLLTSENISIKELDIDNEDGHVTLLRGLITFLIEGLQSRNNFELIQSYIGLLLKVMMSLISLK
jgi:U3 small nucleolar RNA-associated protein 21